jgi:hypothetical protein
MAHRKSELVIDWRQLRHLVTVYSTATLVAKARVHVLAAELCPIGVIMLLGPVFGRQRDAEFGSVARVATAGTNICVPAAAPV